MKREDSLFVVLEGDIVQLSYRRNLLQLPASRQEGTRVRNRFGGMAGSAFFDGRDTGYAITGLRDTG